MPIRPASTERRIRISPSAGPRITASGEIAGPTWRAQSLFPTGFTPLPVRLDLAWRPVAGLVGLTVRTLIEE
jgi:hypothetical protein